MGQAKRRGSYEDRVAQAIKRKEEALQALKDAQQLRIDQEQKAYETMVWWQWEMSYERHERYMHRKHRNSMAMASIMGSVYGMLGGLGGYGRGGFGAIRG